LAPGAWALDIRVCLWEGTSPRREVLKDYVGKYRGTITLQKNGGHWLVVNELDLEDYLYGVVGKEMHKDWPPEALKAQAVCSRTVAVGKIVEAQNRKQLYDVTASVLHQVYGSCEDEKVIKAVEETRGEVLADSGSLAPVYFHSCCGGRTTEPGEVWKGKSPPALAGVGDEYCRDTPYYRWEKSFRKRALADALGIGSVRDIEIEEQDGSGRVKTLSILTEDRRRIRVSGQDLRLQVNGKAAEFAQSQMIPGTMFTVSCTGDRVTFTGRGYGHGVGLCQWGARRMAESGVGYAGILAAFFPRLQIARLKED